MWEVLYPTTGICARQSPNPAAPARVASTVENGAGSSSYWRRISSTSPRLCHQKMALQHAEDPPDGASRVLPCPRVNWTSGWDSVPGTFSTTYERRLCCLACKYVIILAMVMSVLLLVSFMSFFLPAAENG
eukprot:scaffold50544_cov21-Prasinocladus_malaysianus.AAC.1